MISKKNNFLMIVIMLIMFSANLFSSGNGDITSTYSLKADLINQTPDPARSGDVIELKFSVENRGGVGINRVISNLQLDYPFIKMSDDNLTIDAGKLYPLQTGDYAKIIKFKFKVDKDASDGMYKVTLNLLNADTNISNVFDFNLTVVGKEYVIINSINKSNIDFGKVEPLDFIISNVGSSPLKNIVFSWTDSTGTILPVNSDNTKYIQYLDVNSSATISYNVMANTSATPGLYKLDLSLVFENNDLEESSLSTSVGMFVGGTTDFDITFSESSSGSVSLSIANVGNNPAASVNVIIPEQDNFKVTGSNSSIIGNLDIGDYTIVTFAITSKSKAINTNKLLVLVQYTDSLGNRNTVNKEMNLSLSGSSNLGSDQNFNSFNGGDFPRSNTKSTSKIYLYLLIGLVLIGAGYLIYQYKIKKDKKEKK